MKQVDVLVEALPYIRQFNDKVFVVKVGGSTLTDKAKREAILQDVALLKFVGIKVLLVHGGGKEISGLTEKLGLKVKFVEGLRHTDEKTLEVVKMALGKVNSELVGGLERMGCQAVGISGKSAGTLKAKRKDKLGFVGDLKSVDSKLIFDLLNNGYIPVVQPVGMDEKGNAVNINADDVAAGIAKAIKAQKLIFLTNVPGLLEDEKDPKSLISRIKTGEIKEKLKWEEISGGMIPKTKGIIDAIEAGVKSVHIIDGNKAHALLLESLTDEGIGTMITE